MIYGPAREISRVGRSCQPEDEKLDIRSSRTFNTAGEFLSAAGRPELGQDRGSYSDEVYPISQNGRSLLWRVLRCQTCWCKIGWLPRWGSTVIWPPRSRTATASWSSLTPVGLWSWSGGPIKAGMPS